MWPFSSGVIRGRFRAVLAAVGVLAFFLVLTLLLRDFILELFRRLLLVLATLAAVSPSDLPWWGWLLCAVCAALVALGAKIYYDENTEKDWRLVAMVIGFVSVVAAFLLGVIGMVRFIKWIWEA